MKKQLLLLAMILLPLVASAHDIEVQNADGVTIYYNYTNNGTELAVTYRGTSYNSYSNEYSGNVVIPEEVTYMNRTRKVTCIGESAFYSCYGLTSVTIPNSVTNIENFAFEDSKLISITIPNSVTTIGNNAFNLCLNLNKVIVHDIAAWCGIKFENVRSNPLLCANHLYSDENTEIRDLVIPNSVTTIGNYAFPYCSGLTSVTIPNSVTTIGINAFTNCSGLTSVTIPNSVTRIGESAFNNCSGLISIIIGNSVNSIGPNAFDGADIPTVISLIENPFNTNGKSVSLRIFSQNTFMNATLYVPKGTIDKYKAKAGWKDFSYIEEGTGGGETPTTQQCEKPTISYNNGKLTYYCETEGAMCQSTITDADIKSYSSNEVQLTVTYNISVYATKAGYENSETATATLCWIDKEPTTEGITDGVAQIPSKAVLIQSEGGILKVEGVDDGTLVTVYTPDGKQAGSAVCRNGAALVGTNIQPGNTAIVKIGEKTVKVIMK